MYDTPRKHPAPGNSRTPKEIAKWVLDHELQMLYILLDKVDVGIKSPYDKKMLLEITNLLNDRVCQHEFTSVQVKNKIRKFKTNYTNFSMLLNRHLISGFGWDPMTNVVSASDAN